MHNMAIAMKLKGNNVTGSDDEINEPSRSRLDKHGLLPAQMGWYPEKITADIDEVILGMHARETIRSWFVHVNSDYGFSHIRNTCTNRAKTKREL